MHSQETERAISGKLLHNKTKQLIVTRTLFLVIVLLVVTGCTHNINISSPGVPVLAPVASGKGTVQIGAIADRRQTGTELFVFRNPPHTWIYQADERVEDTARKLLRAGLARRGYVESPDAKEGSIVLADILQFSGHGNSEMFVGKCEFKITCAVSISGPNGNKTFVVKGNGENIIGMVTDDNMRQLLSQTYDDFLSKLDQELEAAGY